MEQVKHEHKKVMDAYFDYLNQVYEQKEGALEKLLDLWDDDGIFEFCSTPPVTGTFHGKNAIHALYKARANVKGMPVNLEGNRTDAVYEEAALGFVKREIDRMQTVNKDRVTAWTTAYIATADGRGFKCVGNYTAQFKSGKISKVRITISPTVDAVSDLKLEGLSVDDIGRLALAAWAVV